MTSTQTLTVTGRFTGKCVVCRRAFVAESAEAALSLSCDCRTATRATATTAPRRTSTR